MTEELKSLSGNSVQEYFHTWQTCIVAQGYLFEVNVAYMIVLFCVYQKYSDYGNILKSPRVMCMYTTAGIPQSVQRLFTDWTVPGMNPTGGGGFPCRQDRLRGPLSLLHNEYCHFPGIKRPERCVDHPPPTAGF